MNYEPLARKYRPKNFTEVVGQEHIVSALSNSIKSGRIHHAYLFAGTRGVGKTTMARILAKSLECLNSPLPTTEICGVCDACRGISSGNFVDVQEIDGASNRGIDEIRNLRENIRYAPVTARYKIFIIDEAHQITGAAFNALLKTLEEPPKHAIFILATTESSSIPPTIASRCQRYRFKSIPEKDIAATLKKILSEEKIPFEESALLILARAAAGSMRDAESLTDQAIAFTNRNITNAGIRELLGILPEEMVSMIFEALSSNDTKKLIETVARIMDDGYEPGEIFVQMLAVLRAMLYIVSGVEFSGTQEVSSDFERELARKYIKGFNLERILRLSKIILKVRDELRWAEDVRFVSELYLARMTQPSLSADEILGAIGSHPQQYPVTNSPATVSTDGDKTRENDIMDPTSTSQSSPYKNNDDSSTDGDIYAKLLSSLPSSEERLRACLVNVKIKTLPGKVISLMAPSDFYADNIKRKSDVLISSLEKITGQKYKVEIFSSQNQSGNSNSNGYQSMSGQQNEEHTVADKTFTESNNEESSTEQEVYYDDSDFNTDNKDADFLNGDSDNNVAHTNPASPPPLPEGVKKIKDIFPSKSVKQISSRHNRTINK